MVTPPNRTPIGGRCSVCHQRVGRDGGLRSCLLLLCRSHFCIAIPCKQGFFGLICSHFVNIAKIQIMIASIYGLGKRHHERNASIFWNGNVTSLDGLECNWHFFQFIRFPAAGGTIDHDGIFQTNARRRKNRLPCSANILARICGLTHCKGQHRRIERSIHEERHRRHVNAAVLLCGANQYERVRRSHCGCLTNVNFFHKDTCLSATMRSELQRGLR